MMSELSGCAWHLGVAWNPARWVLVLGDPSVCLSVCGGGEQDGNRKGPFSAVFLVKPWVLHLLESCGSSPCSSIFGRRGLASLAGGMAERGLVSLQFDSELG